jgi:Gas vesicle synthesis protein GvpO
MTTDTDEIKDTSAEDQEEAGRDQDEEEAGRDQRNQDEAEAGRDEDKAEAGQDRDSAQDEEERRPKGHPRFEVIENGVVQLAALIGREPDSVSGFGRSYDDEGWHLSVEVVDVERIPESTSVMASYEAELDDDGNLLEYRQIRRYYRNQSWEQ